MENCLKSEAERSEIGYSNKARENSTMLHASYCSHACTGPVARVIAQTVLTFPQLYDMTAAGGFEFSLLCAMRPSY